MHLSIVEIWTSQKVTKDQLRCVYLLCLVYNGWDAFTIVSDGNSDSVGSTSLHWHVNMWHLRIVLLVVGCIYQYFIEDLTMITRCIITYFCWFNDKLSFVEKWQQWCKQHTFTRAGENMIDCFCIIFSSLLTSQVSNEDGCTWPTYIPGLIDITISIQAQKCQAKLDKNALMIFQYWPVSVYIHKSVITMFLPNQYMVNLT